MTHPAGAVDRVLTGAMILTMDPQFSSTGPLTLSGDRVVVAGRAAGITSLADGRTIVEDLLSVHANRTLVGMQVSSPPGKGLAA